MVIIEVSADHVVPVSGLGAPITVTNLSGGNLYYADNVSVSPSANQGVLTVGQSVTLAAPTWLRADRTTNVGMVYTPPAPVVTSASVGYLSLRQDFALNPSMGVGVLTNGVQNAINAAISAGKGLDLGADLWAVNAPLVIGGNLAVRAVGAQEVWSTESNSGATSQPGAAPWVTGGGLVQEAAGADILQITGTGACVHLRDLVLSFGGSSTFTNTGHAINGVPTLTQGTGHDNGPAGCRWDNLVVFGHDGSHYAYRLINSNLNHFTHLRSYGGGGLYYECDSQVSSFGNSTLTQLYLPLFVGGTADGFHLKSAAPSFPGSLALLKFERPQCNLLNVTTGPLATAYPILASNPPNATNQYVWRDVGNPQAISLSAEDMEGGNTAFGTGTKRYAPYVNNWNIKDENGLVARSFDMAAASSTQGLVGGYIYMVKLMIPQTTLVSNLVCNLSAAGTGLTTNGCLMGLYDSQGNLWAKTADQSTAWATSGPKTMPLAAQPTFSLTLPGGDGVFYWAAFLVNATGGSPAFTSGFGVSFGSVAAIPGASHRFAFESAGGHATLPASMSGLLLDEIGVSQIPWVALA